MRATQIIGLSDKAAEFLKENLQVTKTSLVFAGKRRNVETPTEKKIYDGETGVRMGMFDDGPALYKYLLKDGRWIFEYVQASPWSSGPCIFLALRDESGNPIQESLWSEEEINIKETMEDDYDHLLATCAILMKTKHKSASDAKKIIAGLLQIAKLAMPDTFYESGSRVNAARNYLLDRTKPSLRKRN